MFGQTFEVADLASVGILFFIELLLSADNAIVLSLLSYSLPEKLRTKALFIGLVSSFILRLAALLTVSLLLQYKWLQVCGALYLLYLAIRHFIKKQKSLKTPPQPTSFWKTVVLIELFDLAFALDSILSGLAFITSTPSQESSIHPKLWIVYTGGMLGLIGMRYTASSFNRLLGRFPGMETSAYLLVGWIGVKLAVGVLYPFPFFTPIFWTVLILIFAKGFKS